MGERGGSRFSEFDRRRIVAESYLPDVSVGVVARWHGVSAKQIFTWRRRYGKEKASAKLPESLSEGFPGNLGGGFVPVKVAREDVRDEVPTVRDGDDPGGPSSDGAGGTIPIDLPDGVRVRVTGDVALPVLSCVLRQLRGGGMIGGVASGIKAYLSCAPVDMRKGMNGLAAQVAQVVGHDPYSGHLFVFRGRRGDCVKILHWDGSGLCLYAKRLETGHFVWPPIVDGRLRLTPAQLALLLEGIDWRRTVAKEEPRAPRIT